ncbi:flagellar hook-length control protein FliK [Vibrio maritimus]|uniref:flagellar hook-length control protein FliK n=1 Tax=Vibrio maritimus TaxID=990268 RepID=UPI003734F8D9
MSLSISNNNVSNTVLPKGDGKSSVTEGETGENSGFWDKFKDALSSEKSESDQKVDGASTSAGSKSKSTDAMLDDVKSSVSEADSETDETNAVAKKDAEAASKSAQVEGEDGTALADSKVTGKDKSAAVGSADSDESEQAVKKMTAIGVAAEAGASKAQSIEDTAKSSVNAQPDAKQTVSENAELLSRLDNSNKALQTQAGAGVAAVAAQDAEASSEIKSQGADVASGEQKVSKGNLSQDEAMAASTMMAAGSTQVATKPNGEPVAMSTNSAVSGDSAAASNKGQLLAATGGAAVIQGSDGKLTPANESDAKAATNNIAWSKSDADPSVKPDAKAALAGMAVTTDKTALTQSQIMQGQTAQALAAQNSANPSAAAAGASQGQPIGDMAAAASMSAMMASGQAKSSAPLSTQASGLQIGAAKGTNKALNQPGVGSEGALQAAGAGALTATQVRGEQSAQATGAVQSPLMLTKENAGEQVAERVQMMMSKNLKHVDIRLDPPDLGRMQIRMSLNNDSATVHFTVQNQQTRDMVDQAMPRLREMLSQQGIQLADTSVQQQGQQQRHASHGSGNGGPSSGGTNGSAESDANVEGGVTVDVAVNKNKDGISYYA